MTRIVCLVVALLGLAPSVVAQLQVPLRAVPDTRAITRFGWAPDVLDSLAALEARHQETGLEQAACLYGIVRDTVLHITVAATPLAIVRQAADHVQFRCRMTPWYIGAVHSHAWRPTLDDIELDRRSLAETDTALMFAVVGQGWLISLKREGATAPWYYPPHRTRP